MKGRRRALEDSEHVAGLIPPLLLLCLHLPDAETTVGQKQTMK